MNELARSARQLGNIILRERKRRGWTQTMLADRAGLRQATVSSIEIGETPSKLGSILAVMAALDLELRVGRRSKGSGKNIEDIF